MGQYNRSIKIALDKISGEILEADEVFKISNDPFKKRRQYHSKEIISSCLECDQELTISDSKFNRLHFKHKPGHTFCILSDGNLTPKEQDDFNRILLAKESERHIELKNKIGTLLKSVEGVDSSTISIDNKFIIRGEEKRRPDVYCKYLDKELVFEIQLSDLSLSYILSRYEFYKKYKMYLIWILDDFDIHNQGTLERDIKYLTNYENFFKLDENTNEFRLECEYKYPFLTGRNHLLTKWLKQSISLFELKFDSSTYQAYYFNFLEKKIKTEKKQKIREAEIHQSKILQEANEKAEDIIMEIRGLRKNDSYFAGVEYDINQLNPFELTIFNEKLALKTRTTPMINWFRTAKSEDIKFLTFLITCTKIEKNIHEKTTDNKSLLQTLLENDNLKQFEKATIIKRLLEFNYVLNTLDKEIIHKNISDTKDHFLLITCNKLNNRYLCPLVFEHAQLICLLESAKRQDIFGFNYPANKWIQSANNFIQHYNEYWEYIELAFNYYDIWKFINREDLKGSFSKKLKIYYSTMPLQNYEPDELIKELYPEIFSSKR